MKQIKRFASYALMLTAAVMFMVSCSKNGDPGPAGAAGPKGDNGANGPQGPAGPKGDTGVANVIYSAWLDVAYLPDTDTSATGKVDTIGWYAGLPSAKLTAAMIGKCDVKVYMNFQTAADPVVMPLPYYGSFQVSYYLQPGYIVLNSDVRASTVTYQGNKYYQVRYIIIPGGVSARGAIDWNNYEKVKAWLNIVD